MLGRLLSLSMIFTLVSGCAVQTVSTPFIPEKYRLVGIWAMSPLRNGIANVAEYRADGKVYLHPFNCASKVEGEVEVSDYKLSDGGEWINIRSPRDRFDLKVVAFTSKAMELKMKVSDAELSFRYQRVNEVKPLCDSYVPPQEAGSGVAFEPADFTAAPTLPAHPGMERYIGKWGDEKRNVQVEVRRDADGRTSLYGGNNKLWRNLYNDVSWSGDVLHFQSFAYAQVPILFRHPYHKAKLACTLTPLAEGKMQYSFFIGDQRYDHVLSRVADQGPQ